MTDMPEVHESVEVQAPVDDVYRHWEGFAEFPRFMEYITEVTPEGDGRYRWKAKGPLGATVEWTASIVEEVPNALIAWRSDDGDGVRVNGAVKFEPVGSDRTRIEVNMGYQVPGGPAGEAFAKIFSNPGNRTREDLERFKAMVEGETRDGTAERRAS